MPHPLITIRNAVHTDVPLLGQFGSALMALHHNWDGLRFLRDGPGTPYKYAAWISAQLEKEHILILVGMLNEEVVGYTYSGIGRPNYMALRKPGGVIYDIFVDPPHRRQGLGRALLKRTVADLSEKGAKQITLSTASRNESGQDLFKAAGFRETMIEMCFNIT